MKLIIILLFASCQLLSIGQDDFYKKSAYIGTFVQKIDFNSFEFPTERDFASKSTIGISGGHHFKMSKIIIDMSLNHAFKVQNETEFYSLVEQDSIHMVNISYSFTNIPININYVISGETNAYQLYFGLGLNFFSLNRFKYQFNNFDPKIISNSYLSEDDYKINDNDDIIFNVFKQSMNINIGSYFKLTNSLSTEIKLNCIPSFKILSNTNRYHNTAPYIFNLCVNFIFHYDHFFKGF